MSMRRADPAELVALSDRWRYLSAWRVAFAATVALTASLGTQAAPTVAVAAALVHLAATAGVAATWHRSGRRGLVLHGAALCLDAGLVAIATTAAGTPDAVAAVAVLHVVAVSLLASHRSGIRTAGLLTIGIVAARDQAAHGAFPWRSSIENPGIVGVALLVAIWVAAFVTGSMSAANERELRRHRRDLEQLATLGRALVTTRTVPDVADALRTRLAEHLDLRRMVLVGFDATGAEVLGSTDGEPSGRTVARPPGSVLTRVLADGGTLLVDRLGPQDSWLSALLPDAHGVIVAPIPARARPGAVVIDTGRGRVEARTVLLVEQYAASAAGALDSVTLLEQTVALATIDPLTGLANRRSFDAQLGQALADAAVHGHGVGLVMLDIDRFKAVNDRHGHDAGDRVLVAVARLLRSSCRAGESPARLGGEEFAVLVREDRPGDAARLAERLRAVLPSCDELRPTASFGVTTVRGTPATPGEMLRAADVALYRAKAAGRNRVETAPLSAPLSAPVSAPRAPTGGTVRRAP